ncbi:MAG: hypothetical protein AB1Z98_23340, partial [Nannocystaceae bacterium]
MQGEDRRRRPARGRLAAVGVWLGLGGGLGWGAPGCAAPRSSAPVVERPVRGFELRLQPRNLLEQLALLGLFPQP